MCLYKHFTELLLQDYFIIGVIILLLNLYLNVLLCCFAVKNL